MKTLVFWGGGPPAAARRRARDGARFVLWKEDEAAVLDAAGAPYRRVELGLEELDAIDEAAIAWTKAWGKRPVADGRSVRELLAWKGVSLWWFAELYLHHSSEAPRYVRTIETFHRLLEIEAPGEVEAIGLAPDETVLLARTCTARRILFHGAARTPRLSLALATARRSLASRWNTAKTVAAALKSALGRRPAPPPQDGRRTVLFLSHAAFWRRRRDPESGASQLYEHYFDRLIPEAAADPALRPFVLAVGPRAAFRRRGLAETLGDWLRLRRSPGPYVHVNAYTRRDVLREVLRGTRQVRAAWQALRRNPGVQEAFSQRGVAFGDLCGPDLAGTLLLQLPWAVRSYEEMAAALREVRPAAVCLYAESSGWGRAAVAACRAAGVPSVAIQHGILYPKYYSYRHEPDEADAPLPDRTALFGDAARRFLVQSGRYPPASLVLTGSPKFDELLATARRWDRDALRARLGVAPAEQLVVVASRYRGIRATHQSIGSAFPGLVRAIESLGAARCLVKPHPAEPARAYEERIRERGATRTRVLPPTADLMELLHAADALVTVESLSAVEALVLGRPVLILNMPTNLRELVEAGAALGVGQGEDPAPALRALLFDAAIRERLAAARERYLSDVAHGVDGRATRRILDLIRQTGATPGRDRVLGQ